MNIGSTLLFIMTVCEFFSYLPQLIKIIKTKKSEDISVLSIILWVVSTGCYFIYLLTIGGIILIIAYSFQLMVCLITLVLTIYYNESNSKKTDK